MLIDIGVHSGVDGWARPVQPSGTAAVEMRAEVLLSGSL